jgi:pilus assembly protein Flp/PilA
MTRLLTAAKHIVKSQEGQDLLEYGLTAALIAIVCVAAITSVGSVISNVLWTHIATSF